MPVLTPIVSGLCAAALLLFGAAGQKRDCGSPESCGWRISPVRWLMEPEELRSWHGLETPEAAAAFLAEFWSRRDPDPRREGNPRRELFERRTVEANALFAGDGEMGVLTPRGRAYLLVGAPSSLRQRYRRAPALGPIEARGRRHLETRQVLVESWSWRPEDISPALRRELQKRNWKLALEVEFEVEEGSYSLREGEDLLRLAARSWLREGRSR